MYTANNVKTAI